MYCEGMLKQDVRCGSKSIETTQRENSDLFRVIIMYLLYNGSASRFELKFVWVKLHPKPSDLVMSRLRSHCCKGLIYGRRKALE